MPAMSDLTDDDLNKIRLIIKEEIETQLKPIKADIVSLKENVVSLKEDVARLDGRMTGVEKQNTLIIALVIGLIAFIVAAIGIPQIITARRSKTERDQDNFNQEIRERLETLEKRHIQSP